MDPIQEHKLLETRRYFFGRTATGLGAAALGGLLNPQLFAADNAAAGGAASQGSGTATPESLGVLPKLHHPAKAKRIIWLFMAT